jgi:hypothetical protein
MGDFINTFIYNCISISQISELIKLATNNIKFIDHQDVENLIAFIEQRYAMYKKCEDLFLDFCTSKIPSKYAGVFLLKAKFSKNESSPMLEYIGTALSESSNVDAWHEILNSVTDEKVKKEIIESKKNVPIITQKTLSKKETNKIFSFNKMFEDEEW